ncbi:MAG: hypothetical protein IJT44_05225 [Clostridia bacterium]|nr:hypothetical protein [Clostridia bacterium]
MKKLLSVLLCILFVCAGLPVAVFAADDYTIVSPYAQVVWDGDGAWGAYKGNLHTHSTFSDAEMNLNEMVLEHYNQGFDFLAMTDHGVTGTPWNEAPARLPLYWYQYLLGYKQTPLTDEEFAAVTDGSYPVDGAARGKGMVCVTGGNELNALTITKCHVNGMFLPEHVGDNYLGYENDHEGAVRLADKAGALSFINHPGDWLHSNRDIAVVSDPENVHYYADILLKYDSCLGMEVFNERNHTTPYDRILWDNVLMECLPYGKRVIGYSNNDAHFHSHVDSSFSVFMMPENTVENIKETMQSGAFFCVTRELRNNDLIGPAEEFDVRYSETPYPAFRELSVDGHTVTVRANNCTDLQWIANGKVIAHKTVEQSEHETTYVLDLDSVENVKDFLYIRCELFGEGGATISQALILDRGTEPKTYEPDTSARAKLASFGHRIASLRIVVLFQIIADEISSSVRRLFTRKA